MVKAAEETKVDPLGPNCTVIRRNWGQPSIPRDKRDYLDEVAFQGGVAKNVPTKLARTWERLGLGVHVLPANATEAEFIKATGVQPMPAEQFAAMLRGYDLAQISQVLGEEGTLKLAGELRRLVRETRE